MQDLIRIHKAFEHIEFHEAEHRYFDKNDGTELISVTTLLRKFQKPFDKNYWLSRKAKEYGIEEEELDNQWKQTKKIGVSRGTILHKYLEDKFANKVLNINYPDFINQMDTVNIINYHRSLDSLFKMADNFIEQNKLIPIKSELVIGDSDFGVAGMVDHLFYDEEREGLVLVDIKSDKRIAYSSPYNKYFLHPIKHLSDCEFNKYSLQTSLYRFIFERNTEIPILEQLCVWFNFKNDTFEIIPLTYYKQETNDILTAI